MRLIKTFASFAVLAGMALTAQDGYWDARNERRDLRHDYARADHIRNDIARDRWRLNEDMRRGRERAAAHEARDIARDERRLGRQMRDIHRDQRDLYRERY